MRQALANNRQTILTAAAALVLAFALPHIFYGIDYLGINVHNSLAIDTVDDYIKACWAALFLFGALLILPFPKADKKNLLLAWLAKVTVALGVMLFYERNYGLDAYWYFQQSQATSPDMTDVGFGNGTANILALTWGFEHFIIRTASYHTQKLLCAFLGMLGIYFFYRGLKSTFAWLPNRIFLYLCLFPSILFWSSILGKDPLIIFGIGLSFYAMMGLKNSRNLLYIGPLALGLFVIGMMRSWMVPIVFFPFVIGAIAKFKNIGVRIVVFCALLAFAYFNFHYVMDNFEFSDFDAAAKGVGNVATSWNDGGSAGYVPVINTPAEALSFMPFGMLTALFRPLPGEVMNPFGLLAGLENLVILFLLWKALRAWRWETWKDHLVVWFGSYVLIWSSVYAFLSPQNLGSAVRFRLQVLPVMLFLFYYIARRKSGERKADQF